MDTRELAWASIAGVAHGTAAFLILHAIQYTTAPSTRGIAAGAIIGATLFGAMGWWALIAARPEPHPVAMGLLVGLTAGMVSHLPAWIGYGIVNGELFLVVASPLFTAYSTALIGWWLTGPIAGVVGLSVGTARWLADRRRENQDE